MTILIRSVDVYSHTINGSTIHKQGSCEFLAVGPEEIARLPKRQRVALENLQRTSKSEINLTAFVDISDGTLLLNDYAMVAAAISQRGETRKIVAWL